MKKKIFLSLIGLFVGLFFSTHAFSLTLYDDFSGTYIDKGKWKWGEWVREINGGKLILKQASPNPVAITSYPYADFNWLRFSNQNSVNSIQADVTISENIVINQAEARVGLGGRWYNDGTAGGGTTGDIWGEIALRSGGPTGLVASWGVAKFTNSDGTSLTVLGGGDFITPITLGTTYTAYIGYDSVANQFIFRIGIEEVTFGPTGLPARVGNANSSFKGLGTRVEINNAASSGYISATFDNVYKNGSLYDDFSSLTIDPTKWNTYEFVREISGGKLRSKTRSSSASTSFINNVLELLYPSSINAFQAEVTLLDYQNPQGLTQRVRIIGSYYNDGSPGGGLIGDVYGQIRIGGTGATPVAEWLVYRFTDSAGNNSELVAKGTFTTSIVVGNTYTLYLGWNGSQFTFKVNSEVTNYIPATSINLVHVAFKQLSARIDPETDKKEGTIEALFDDVMVNARVVTADFNGDGETDILWRNKSTGQNVVWFMNGTTYSNYAELLQVPDTNWEIVGTGDFNGDGKTDILWRNKISGQNVIWLMNGTTYSSYAELIQVSDTNWEIVGTGDFNSDGKTDILWRNKATGENVVWFMDGATKSDWSWILPEVPDTNWEIVGTGDFNGDGKTDILWRNKATGQNVVWFMDGAIKSDWSWILPEVPDTNWEIVGTGDFNGDGKTDILWRNKISGQNVIWLMNGTTYSTYVRLLQVPDTNWEIVGPK